MGTGLHASVLPRRPAQQPKSAVALGMEVMFDLEANGLERDRNGFYTTSPWASLHEWSGIRHPTLLGNEVAR